MYCICWLKVCLLVTITLEKREWWRMEIRARGIKPLNIFMPIIFIFSMHILNITICPPKTWKMFSQVFQQKTKGWTYLANWCKIFITIFSPIFSLWCSSLCLLCLIQINPYRTFYLLKSVNNVIKIILIFQNSQFFILIFFYNPPWISRLQKQYNANKRRKKKLCGNFYSCTKIKKET